MHDGGERIGEIALFQRILEFDDLNTLVRLRSRGNHPFAHESPVNDTRNRNKW
jgi:hypothetical protein